MSAVLAKLGVATRAEAAATAAVLESGESADAGG